MNNRRTKQLPKILMSQLFVGLIMAVMAIAILTYAQGYRFNLKNFKIIKTGIVFLSSYPKGADVYIDGKIQENKTPFSTNLISGVYTAEVKKDGYKSWYASFKITPSMVTDYKAIVLFKDDIKVKTLEDKNKIELLNSPIDSLAVIKDEGSLSTNGYEIWLDDILVTRFSERIEKVLWYPDMEHILFQSGNEIRVIDKDGYNDTLLVKLSKNEPTRFMTNNKGNELYFVDNGEYKVAEIR